MLNFVNSARNRRFYSQRGSINISNDSFKRFVEMDALLNEFLTFQHSSCVVSIEILPRAGGKQSISTGTNAMRRLRVSHTNAIRSLPISGINGSNVATNLA
jgi:hypothetical protein